MIAPTIRIRRPTAPPADDKSAPSFRVERPITNLRVGIRTDGAWRSWTLIAGIWDGYLRRDGATTLCVERKAMIGEEGAADHERVARMAEEVDCAISGLGTCGSCTSFTIADAVAVEKRAKPAIAIVTAEFETHGRNMARHLGHRDLKVLVLPYPLEARPEAELREIADAYYPQALALLGISS